VELKPPAGDPNPAGAEPNAEDPLEDPVVVVASDAPVRNEPPGVTPTLTAANAEADGLSPNAV
jgi:hypothetical protein